MSIINIGEANLTANIVPDVTIQLVAPQVQIINGVQTGRVGMVGTAAYGPVGIPVSFGSYDSYVRNFGPLQYRPFDMGVLAATAYQQGATDMYGVRVTDGTDTAASAVVQTNCLTLTAKYTGGKGNDIKVDIGPGSQLNTYKATVNFPGMGMLPEIFDNLSGTGNALWVQLASAINNGQALIRSASEIVVATAGAGTAAPATASYALTGGSDGTTSVTDATLVGVDTIPRKGMYSLRNTGCRAIALAEVDDTSTWPAQVALGRKEGAYMVLVGAAGESVSAAVAAKQAAGIDDMAAKVLLGDWPYWLDSQNNVAERLVSPQGFALGRYATLSPEQSALNKPVFAIIGTQRTKMGRPLGPDELIALGQAGIDTITSPSPGGDYYSMRFGRNSSSNPTIRGDNHTRLSYYLAATLQKGMGPFVGQTHTAKLRNSCKASLDNLFGNMVDLDMLEWFNTICNESNNPINRRGAGWLQANVQARYYGIVEQLVVNLEGGTTVQVTRLNIQPAAA